MLPPSSSLCRYTTMVGKKVTLKALRKELHARHVTAIRTTEFAQVRTWYTILMHATDAPWCSLLCKR